MAEIQEGFLPNRPRPLAEAQLVILYLLSRLESATDANLLDFLTEARLMNYMEMMPALKRLVQEDAIGEMPEGAFRRYALKAGGTEMLSLYGARIPISDRDAIDQRTEAWRATLRAERDYQADMAQTPRGDYEVSLRMMERGRPVMTLSVCLPSSDIAARLVRRWRSEGGRTFESVLAPLLEEEP